MGLIINFKKLMTILILILIGILMFIIAGLMFNKSVVTGYNVKNKSLPIYKVETDDKLIAVTLDCAWENSNTKELLDIFERNDVKVTFFVTGDFCNRYNDDVKQLASKGHSIQNHSYNHPHINKIGKEKIIEDTDKCNKIIEELVGKKPSYYRSPYGEYNNNNVNIIENDIGMQFIQWSLDSRDWQKKSVEDIVQNITQNVKSGDIILFHNDLKNSEKALEQIIPILKGEGYKFVTVDELVYKDNYEIDNQGTQKLQK